MIDALGGRDTTDVCAVAAQRILSEEESRGASPGTIIDRRVAAIVSGLLGCVALAEPAVDKSAAARVSARMFRTRRHMARLCYLAFVKSA